LANRLAEEKGMTASNNQTTDEVRIRQLMEAWAKAVRARDIDGILENHAPDIVLFDVPLPVQSRGIDAYRKSWEQFFPWFGDSGVFELQELNITAGEDVAFCHGLIHCGATETGRAKVDLVVRLTVCCRKVNGKWVVVHEHHSEPSGTT
jgi:uncharacterized protein (TIGR02246 family)